MFLSYKTILCVIVGLVVFVVLVLHICSIYSFSTSVAFLKEIAWRAEAVRSLITGDMPLITKETANSAMTDSAFSTAKIEKILGAQFTDIDITINKYANWFISDQP